MITSLTLNNPIEAIGIARAAKGLDVPSVIALTVQNKGFMKTGQTLQEGVEETDSAPAYYMINCAHPVDFLPAINDETWIKRLRGIRPNASSLAHGVLC